MTIFRAPEYLCSFVFYMFVPIYHPLCYYLFVIGAMFVIIWMSSDNVCVFNGMSASKESVDIASGAGSAEQI